MPNHATNCPKCGSENVIFSKKRQRHVCEDCEHEFVVDKPIERLRIFLSYGHDGNEPLVRRIKADLEKRGHDVWFDKSGIKEQGIVPGDDWRRAITDGIVHSNRVVSFLSKHSTRDPGV
ncbi:MAG: TIR domain-containing protein, partial [Planctomycetaceae bacterium]|nr:TIR domain-containing protein [Planctomycetaceae bacterium]